MAWVRRGSTFKCCRCGDQQTADVIRHVARFIWSSRRAPAWEPVDDENDLSEAEAAALFAKTE